MVATLAPSLVLIKWRGQKILSRQQSGLTLTLTFEHVKSIGIIYSLSATPAPSLVLIKWRGQKILSGQHLVYRPTDIPTDIPTDRPTVAKQYAPFFKGGIKILPSIMLDSYHFLRKRCWWLVLGGQGSWPHSVFLSNPKFLSWNLQYRCQKWVHQDETGHRWGLKIRTKPNLNHCDT